MCLPVVAKDRYKICLASAAGQGCSRETFDKKTAFKVRDLLVQAPIPADYAVWVEDKTGASVRGPNDPPVPTELKEQPTKPNSNNTTL